MTQIVYFILFHIIYWFKPLSHGLQISVANTPYILWSFRMKTSQETFGDIIVLHIGLPNRNFSALGCIKAKCVFLFPSVHTLIKYFVLLIYYQTVSHFPGYPFLNWSMKYLFYNSPLSIWFTQPFMHTCA